jgi:hypothetical protein
MNIPKCWPHPPSRRYKRVVVRSLWSDGETLTIEVQGDGFAFARVVFQRSAGFRLLDERDLCEFWDDYHSGNGWLYEVEQGGWLELESSRPEFLAPHMFPGLREYLLVCDKCVSVLAIGPPEIIDLGTPPVDDTPE